jgi:cyclopropane fatty-acyl-phospholipid synthase-like methyltransferase
MPQEGQAPDPRPIVETGYDRVADSYAALEAEDHEWPRMRWLKRLLDRIEPGAEILDVGCGNGVPATRAMAARHRALGVDVSAAQIERAKRNVPNAEFIHADLSELEFTERFAALTAFYVIEHIPRERHHQVFQRFREWLLPGACLLFTIEPEDEPGVVGNWLGEPMFFSQYEAGRTLELLREAGFETLETGIEDQLEGGREVTYLWVLARRT